MEKITASIVTYKNDPELLSRTINSFLESSITGPLTIIDNSPTDALRKICEKHNIHYVFSGKNLGYGKAHNLAIRQYLHQSGYHVVLNPDVFFGPEVLEKIFNFMEAHPRAGLAMPKVLDPSGNLQMLCKLLPTPLDLALRRFFPIESWFRNQNRKYEMHEGGYDRIMNVPFLSGCFMFLRTEALEEVGLFDERFFLYAEDTDLSRRVHQRYETLFFPGAEINHVHARGSYKDFNLTIQNLKSAIQYFNKWGWFFDEDRMLINQRAFQQIQSVKISQATLKQADAV